jgi:hypothetical protein
VLADPHRPVESYDGPPIRDFLDGPTDDHGVLLARAAAHPYPDVPPLGGESEAAPDALDETEQLGRSAARSPIGRAPDHDY